MYETVGKSCGNCSGSVPLSATVGDRCPHCGVIWGASNSQTISTPGFSGSSGATDTHSSGKSEGEGSRGSASKDSASSHVHNSSGKIIAVLLIGGLIIGALFIHNASRSNRHTGDAAERAQCRLSRITKRLQSATRIAQHLTGGFLLLPCQQVQSDPCSQV